MILKSKDTTDSDFSNTSFSNSYSSSCNDSFATDSSSSTGNSSSTDNIRPKYKSIIEKWVSKDSELRPSPDLLEISSYQEPVSLEEQEYKSKRLVKAFDDLKFAISVEGVVTGPVVSRYDIRIAPGVRTMTIVNLESDLQQSLMCRNINIIETVPGTPFIGIEIPNDKRQMIRLGDILDSSDFSHSKAKLPIGLGVDAKGPNVIADLTDAPHLLIAGTKGSGKTSLLNSMLISLLLAKSPDELRLILVDPKTNEFSQYQNLPHLLTPVITDVDSTVATFEWLIKEMERRYKLLSLMHQSKVSELNDFIKEKNLRGEKVYDPMWCENTAENQPELKTVPYIVLVIDEFADLISVASVVRKKDGNTPEALIARLTARASAAGIHLILATETPRADIVTGAIKANIPSHIAFTVEDEKESRIILYEGGAQKLLGKGDMLVKYKDLNRSQMFRAQAPFVSSDEIERVVAALHLYYGDPEYVEGITESNKEDVSNNSSIFDGDDYDITKTPLDPKLVEVVDYARANYLQVRRFSVTELQTSFGFGYTRARKIYRQMQSLHILDDNGYLNLNR